MIGIDAAEISLVEQWMTEGALPNLRSLKERGAYGPLASTAEWLVGSPWPTFYTSTGPSEHGMYHYLIWRPEHMATERPNSNWMPFGKRKNRIKQNYYRSGKIITTGAGIL